MNRTTSKSWLDAKILRQLIAQTLAEFEWKMTWYWYGDPESPLSPSPHNGGDCKMTQVIYDKCRWQAFNIYIVWSINLQMWVLENSARRRPMTPEISHGFSSLSKILNPRRSRTVWNNLGGCSGFLGSARIQYTAALHAVFGLSLTVLIQPSRGKDWRQTWCF